MKPSLLAMVLLLSMAAWGQQATPVQTATPAAQTPSAPSSKHAAHHRKSHKRHHKHHKQA